MTTTNNKYKKLDRILDGIHNTEWPYKNGIKDSLKLQKYKDIITKILKRTAGILLIPTIAILIATFKQTNQVILQLGYTIITIAIIIILTMLIAWLFDIEEINIY